MFGIEGINSLNILKSADTLFVFLSGLVQKLRLFEYYIMYNLPPTILNLPPTHLTVFRDLPPTPI